MAIKTFINGQENGVITFKGDTEPCAVYVDGERQDNISYVPQEVTGENSVQYSSEYKKNVRTMQIDGNTEQYQGLVNATVPFDIEQWLETNNPTMIYPDNGTLYFPCAYFDTKIPLPSTGTFRLNINYNGPLTTDELVIAIAYTESDIASKSGSYKVIFPYTEDVYVDQPFYLIASKPSGDISYGDDNWNEYPKAITLYSMLSFTGDFSSPSPYAPSPIQNAGDSGIECVLRGVNLFDIDNYTNLGTNKTLLFDISHLIIGTKYTITSNKPLSWFKISTSEGGVNSVQKVDITTGFTKFTFTMARHQNIAETSTQYLILGTLENYLISGGFGAVKDISLLDGYEIQIVEGTQALPYQPYFHKTLSLPSSVTVDGQEVQLRFGEGDKLIVDRLANKITYTSTFDQYTFTGNESGWLDRTSSLNVDGKSRFSNNTILNPYTKDVKAYCNISKVTKIGGITVDSDNGVQLYYVSSNLGTNSKVVYFTLPTMTLAEFTQWLKDNLTTLRYEIETPIEYVLYDKANNITTELGQQILDFVNSTQNATNIIEITATPSVSNLNVNYAEYWGNINNENNS